MKKKIFFLVLFIQSVCIFSDGYDSINMKSIREQIKKAGFGGDLIISYVGNINRKYDIFYITRYVETEYNVRVYNALIIFEDLKLRGYYLGLPIEPKLENSVIVFPCDKSYGNQIIIEGEIPKQIRIDGELFYFQLSD